MWLLNTQDFHLCNFLGGDVPPYAILSHRWEEDEVSFENMSDAGMKAEHKGDEADLQRRFPLLFEMRTFHKEKLLSKRGWRKLKNFCNQAYKRGYEYGWIDTCCINKSSSAELQEAINSMYRWYSDADLCLVFMNDVSIESKKDTADARTQVPEWVRQFRASKWFSRGWTLQELLAPERKCITFLDCQWREIGDDEDLAQDIFAVTSISYFSSGSEDSDPYGRGKWFYIEDCSVAEKMSWAATRTTTRPEDQAYSLLGLFGVSMPLLYGEGRTRAFRRLQEEIVKNTSDESILAFFNEHRKFIEGLADSPRMFATSWRVSPFSNSYLINRGRHLVVTARGLQMNAKIKRLSTSEKEMISDRKGSGYLGHKPLYLAALSCTDEMERLVFLLLEDMGSHWRRMGVQVWFDYKLEDVGTWEEQVIYILIDLEQYNP